VWVVFKSFVGNVGNMESCIGDVLSILKSLDARLSGLELNSGRGRGQLGARLEGKRMRDDVDIWKLWDFLQQKAAEHDQKFLMYSPKVYGQLFDNNNEAIFIQPFPERGTIGRALYVQVVDLKFKMYTRHHMNHNFPVPDRSARREVDERLEDFETIHDYEDIDAVWRELKRLFELPRDW